MIECSCSSEFLLLSQGQISGWGIWLAPDVHLSCLYKKLAPLWKIWHIYDPWFRKTLEPPLPHIQPRAELTQTEKDKSGKPQTSVGKWLYSNMTHQTDFYIYIMRCMSERCFIICLCWVSMKVVESCPFQSDKLCYLLFLSQLKSLNYVQYVMENRDTTYWLLCLIARWCLCCFL